MIYQWFVNKKSTRINRIDFGCWMLYLCNAVKKQCLVTIYISIHHLNRLYLKAIQEMLKIRND